VDTGKPSGSHARLLTKAAEILGGERKLRDFLRAPEKFERWLEGKSMLPDDLFLKLADLLNDHNQDFVSQNRPRQDELLEKHQSLKESSRELIESARALVARSRDTRKWSVVLRSARLGERETDRASGLKHRLFEPSFVPTDRAELLETALDATLAMAGTELGNVQLIDVDGTLRIEAHRGFQKPFLEFFSVVSQPESGVAMSIGRQVFIPDVRRSSMFMGTDAGKVLDRAGCKAVISSPLVHDTGLVVGMISTHYHEPCTEHQAPLASLELIAKRAASWLDARTS
jgi:hypothetical protein